MSECETSFTRKINIIGSRIHMCNIVIVLAFVLVVQSGPTTVVFEENFGQLLLVFVIVLENMVQGEE